MAALRPSSSYTRIVYFSASPHTCRMHDADGEISVVADPLPSDIRKMFDVTEHPLCNFDTALWISPGVRTVHPIASSWTLPSPEQIADLVRVAAASDAPDHTLIRVFVSVLTANAIEASHTHAEVRAALGPNVDLIRANPSREPGNVTYDEKGNIRSTGAAMWVTESRPWFSA